MKKLLLLAFLFCGSAAFGQTYLGSPNMVTPYSPNDHRQMAAQKDMADLQNLRGTNTYLIGHGEQPLWEFNPHSIEPPLGDVARMYREKHATAKKAQVRKEN
jgi:hypothetical protein